MPNQPHTRTALHHYTKEDAACACGTAGDPWCQALIDVGYPGCRRCGLHHRRPETCAEDDRA